jgi:RNA polymerase sigma-70 factor (ECF subfamily)
MESSEAFLKTTIVRASIDVLRTRKRSAEQFEESIVDSDQERVAIRHVLARLKPDQQAILALFIGEGWTHAEIAETLKIPPGTVASRIHSAKEAFRREWGNER